MWRQEVEQARAGIDAANECETPEETLKTLGPVLVALVDAVEDIGRWLDAQPPA